jgi:hypothetical protein
MTNLSFSYLQNRDFLFGKSLFLGGYCNGNEIGLGKIAIKGKEISSDITLFPNPTNTEFSIKSDSKIKEVSISNSLGQVLLTTDKQKSISVESLSTGIYFVTITLESGEVKIQKLIIN